MGEKRKDFSIATKDLIAKRAGYKCSFPGCGKLLVGPSSDEKKSVSVGECAHIYSAVPGGPRGQGNLSEEELVSANNGIYLCSVHHTMIDNAGGKKYTAEELMLMKEMHEFDISCELGENQYPLLWIKSVKYISSPNISDNLIVSLTKNTIITGTNASGKSTFIENLYSALTEENVERWTGKSMEIEISLSNAVRGGFVFKSSDGRHSYIKDGKTLPYVPDRIEVFALLDKQYNDSGYNDVSTLAQILGLEENYVVGMIESADFSNSYYTKSARIIQEVDEEDSSITRTIIKVMPKEEYTFEHDYEQLSGTEKTMFTLDLVLAYLTMLSQTRPTLLLIDWYPFCCLYGDVLKFYLHKIHLVSNKFQSIIVTYERFDTEWTGWSEYRFEKNNIKPKI